MTPFPASSPCVCDPRTIFVPLSYTGLWPKKPILTKDGMSSPHSQSSAKELNLFAQKNFPGRVGIGKADTGGELVQLGLDPIITCHCHSRVCVGRKSSEDGLWGLQGPFHPPKTYQEKGDSSWLNIPVRDSPEGQWPAHGSTNQAFPKFLVAFTLPVLAINFSAENRNTPGTGSTQPPMKILLRCLRLKTEVSLCVIINRLLKVSKGHKSSPLSLEAARSWYRAPKTSTGLSLCRCVKDRLSLKATVWSCYFMR